MSIQELEAEALKLPERERAKLVARLLASMRREAIEAAEDPILRLGSSPVSTGVLDGAAQHDRYLYGSRTTTSITPTPSSTGGGLLVVVLDC
ncbi:MAG TPA: hypothetical protein VF710_01555 [Longimicrobium sp.]|jgi:hypothetical protein